MAWLAAQAACLAPVRVCGYFLLKDVVVGAGRRANWPTVKERMGEEGVGQGSSVPTCGLWGSRLPLIAASGL